jgi:SAM-dependent methyltransferase
MTVADEGNHDAAEQQRIIAEFRRRDREVDDGLYAPWNPSAIYRRQAFTRTAALDLARNGVFPRPGQPCLEIGYGSRGWLAELLGWGLRERDLHGMELDGERAAVARETFPVADLRIGDASHLPWPDGQFRLVIASTVFSSILDAGYRRKIAAEAIRVLSPGGALLWYDLRVNNPSNSNVRRIDRSELRGLFPGLSGTIRPVTLAPPLARVLIPRMELFARILEAIPLTRTHLLAVLVKGGS